MEVTENAVYAALGINNSEPAPAAAETPAPSAEPTVQQQTAPETGSAPATESGSAEPEAEEESGTQTEQSADERHANAARRRAQEQQAAIDKAVSEALKGERDKQAEEMKAFFGKAKLKNTITGADITSMDEFNAWDRDFSEAKMQRDLKTGKVTRETIDQIVASNPTVKAAQEIIDKQTEAQKAKTTAENQAKLDAEIAEIGKIDPTIKSAEDLLTMPNAKAFYNYVQKGLSFKDAYYLTHREQADSAAQNAARQQAMTNSRGKDHLSGTANGRGGGSVSVPAADMAMFRLMMPNATKEQIQQYYNQYKNK